MITALIAAMSAVPDLVTPKNWSCQVVLADGKGASLSGYLEPVTGHFDKSTQRWRADFSGEVTASPEVFGKSIRAAFDFQKYEAWVTGGKSRFRLIFQSSNQFFPQQNPARVPIVVDQFFDELPASAGPSRDGTSSTTFAAGVCNFTDADPILGTKR